MKTFTVNALKDFFTRCESEYEVMVPIKGHDGTRQLGKLEEGELSLLGGKLAMKPTSLFFPQLCAILNFDKNKAVAIKEVYKPLLIAGFTAEDANCLEFIDRFFSQNFEDDIYFDRRRDAVIICITGYCGKGGEFHQLANKNCDIELVYDGKQFFGYAHSEKGESLLNSIQNFDEIDDGVFKTLKEKSDTRVNEDTVLLQKASTLLLENKVPDEFWAEIGKRCISCSACTLLCPTCTCFDLFDRKSQSGELKRWRMADSCQLDGFMREASGHNPLGTEALRTRRRIHHKLAADVERWGHITCFLCGRCDDVCPSNIGIQSVCREMVEKYG